MNQIKKLIIIILISQFNNKNKFHIKNLNNLQINCKNMTH